MFLSAQQVTGDVVKVLRSNPLHIDPQQKAGQPENAEQAFGQLLLDAFNNVNDKQQEAAALSLQMFTDPDSVNVHDVTIAGAEANMSLAITKAVVDGALRAYREIINTR